MASYTRRETSSGPSFLIRSSCGYTADGKQVLKSMTWRPDPNMSEKAIEKELMKQMVYFDMLCADCGERSGNIKFETFAKEWFKDYAEANLRKTTLARCRDYEERTYKAIGHLRVDRITARHIQSFLISIQKPGVNKNDPSKGLSSKTARNYLSFISSIFEYAGSLGMIKTNPCKGVPAPSPAGKEREIYSVEEAIEFLENLEGEPMKYQAFFNLAIYGGFRRGEILGLEWKDVDFDNELVSIKRTSLAIRGEKPFTDKTKTKESCRIIKLPACVFEVLQKLQIEQNEERKRIGDDWEDNDRLFTTWNGGPMRVETPRNWLLKFCERNNLRYVSVHSFRHLNATLLIGSGADITTVSAALGHSKPTTTLNIYSHAYHEQQAKASAAVADRLKLTKKSEQ